MITLSTELSHIRGLGEQFLEKLGKLNIKSVEDLLWHFPSRYEDFSKVIAIADLGAGITGTIRGVVKRCETRRTWRRNMVLVEIVVADDSGGIKAVWFNQPYLARILRVGMHVSIAGKVSAGDDELYFSNPSYEPLREGEVTHTAGLIPIYPETRGLTSRGLRYLIRPILKVLPPLEEFVPQEVLKSHHFPTRGAAFRQIHFPETIEEAERAKARFAFEDLFLLQLHNVRARLLLAKEHAIPLACADEDRERILHALPFVLTGAQVRTLEEILHDLQRTQPMNRLLQGDVGSGKTVIAAIAATVAGRNGTQTAFMAPTEVLARQHFKTLHNIFETLMKEWGLRAGLLLGSTGVAEKRMTLAAIAKGEVQIIIGTHALIESTVKFDNLALVVIDEQHRFGVEQRAKLVARRSTQTKTQTNADTTNIPRKSALAPSNVERSSLRESATLPHLLSMSATPIPRTLSLTLFGDLDLSLIDELPKGRQTIITKVVAPENRAKAYAFVRGEIKKGRQVFVICPRISADTQIDADDNADKRGYISENLRGDLRTSAWSDVKAVKDEYEKLSKTIFPDLRIAMLHGKMPARGGSASRSGSEDPSGSRTTGGKSKQEIMDAFHKGNIDMLVATSVIEVGVDVANASVMIVEGAERFGLSQLYQFRGRIGRGEHQSFCFLFTDSKSESTEARLNALLTAKNGFELAEKDLAIRGPGEFLGSSQTGIPDLAMSALTDITLIKSSRDSAQAILEKDPELEHHPLLHDELARFERGIHLE